MKLTDSFTQKEIYISQETRESIISVFDLIPELLPDEIERLIILSPEDCVSGGYVETAKSILGDHYNSMPLEKRNKEQQEKYGYPGSKPFAYSFDTNGDGQIETAFIMSWTRDRTKAEIFTQLSTSPALESLMDVGKVPGTDVDWRGSIIIHEIGHLHDHVKRINSRYVSIPREAYADQFMIDNIPEKMKGVAKAKIGARAISAFYDLSSAKRQNDQRTHLTSAFVKSASEKIPPLPDFDAHDIELMEGWSERNKPQIIARIRAGNIKADIAGARNVISNRILENHIGQKNELLSDKSLIFQAAKGLYEEGAFESNPIQSQYVWEFLEAVQSYVPEEFGVSVFTIFNPPNYENDMTRNDFNTLFTPIER